MDSSRQQSTEEYNPFEHRQIKNANSTLESFVHVIKASFGTGILALPLAFKNGGLLFGIPGTILVASVYTHCIRMLVSTSWKVCKLSKVPLLDYAKTAECVFLHSKVDLKKYKYVMRSVVNTMLFMGNTFTIGIYLVFIATNLRSVINSETSIDWSIRIYILLVGAFIAIISQIRELKYLVPLSLLANFSLLLTFAISMYYIFEKPFSLENRNLWPDFAGLPSFFATIAFAIEGASLVLPVENKMKNPENYLKPLGVVNVALACITVLCLTTGFSGYATFGDEIQGSVTLNLPTDEALAKSTQLLAAGAILLTTGLYYYVPMEILWGAIEPKVPVKRHNLAQITMRFSHCLFVTGSALLVPNLGSFIDFVGAIVSVSTSMIIPIVLDTALRWPGDFGRMKWRLWKNGLLGAFACLILVTGTFYSIKDIVNMYR
ncbi:proton-coupled amino acid transporter-like protein pathetic [Uranotaenia lowii]|uniref:proton-coupled amino acid transporter-like protein pathetic n=1 Tax=Uranotaenia lowii TaxID=190385 RepID=UPI00247B12B8|nr:proton-coupled amino acid transporter-like protein pathetic [Uranotaenia lowii]